MPDDDAATVADATLLEAVDLARAALLDVTPAETVGPVVGHIVEGEHVLTLLFESALAGYPGWRWSVTISRLDGDAEPAVLETELMPGEASLLAPDWIPWSERLADYQASQEALAADAASGDEDEDEESDDDLDDLDEDDDDDDDDDDDSGVPVLHSGDIDGVDIDFDDPEQDEDDADIDVTLDLAAEESAALDADVDEADDTETESDEDGPEPPAVAGGRERNGEDQH
ncbi:DUF3027 domain-containing protein [Diaminobutyricibacter sp. McL0618]|uniref:DUF3027 domain-containing protein n=1 Tax=Leifsonia sp. McL0618 TaxID=3415677 RepID=UPI003CE91622